MLIADRCRRRSVTTCAAFYRGLRDKDGLSHEDAVRDTLVSVLVSPHFLFRLDARAAWSTWQRRATAFGPCPGQPPELLPLVQHARRGVAGPRQDRRFAPPGHADCPGPADGARRPHSRPGDRVCRQLARFPPFRGAQRRGPRAASRHSTTTCGKRCSRSRSVSSWIWPAPTARCSICFTPTTPSSIPVAGQALRHAGADRPATGDWVQSR